MDEIPAEPLPVELQLALVHSGRALRPALRVAFELDRRLARIVSATTEPMLGQMRLAWWRDVLGQDVGSRPQGDRVLDAIGLEWAGREEALVALVDGWEHMLAETLSRADAEAFAAGRAAPFAAMAERIGTDTDMAGRAGRRWALADAASHIGAGEERELLLERAAAKKGSVRLPRALRGLSVLDALARRSIARDGRPLMEGRAASLVAARAAIIGR